MDNIELLINKLEHILTIIPNSHPLSDCISSHIRSLYYCPPEGIWNRSLLIAESLAYFLGEANNPDWLDWQRKVYEIWMQPLNNKDRDVDEPTELEQDVDLSDCGIVLLSQQEDDNLGDDGDIWLD